MLNKILFLLVLIGKFASVQAVPYFLWDNQDGLVDANECQITPTSGTRFKVSSATSTKIENLENLRTYHGFKQSYLASGSLIKVIDGKEKKNYKFVEVVGPVKYSDQNTNRWYSERLDKGYLFVDSVDELKNHVIKLGSDTPSAKINDELSLSQATLKALTENNKYQEMNCDSLTQKRSYTVFSIHQKRDEAPIAYVGVYWDETQIFRSVATLSSSSNDWKGSILAAGVKEPVVEEEVVEASELTPLTISLRPVQRPEIAGVAVSEGSNTMIVCMESGSLKVRNEELTDKIFTAQAFESVALFSSWDEEDTKVLNIAGTDYEYIKVKFLEREAADQQVGWVAKSYIQSKSDCEFKEPQADLPAANQVQSLDDSDCCIYPVKARPTANYTNHRVAKFGASRGGGSRKHGATDLYRFKNEPVVAIAPGRVIVGLKPFYYNSYYVVVKHVGGKVVRYGETTGQAVKGASSFNDQLSAGETLGYVQQIITSRGSKLTPMLHFEMYTGEVEGDLSLSWRIEGEDRKKYNTEYQRRKDIMDPTTYMQKWEKKMFGRSY